MKLSSLIVAMDDMEKNSTHRELHVTIKPLYGLNPIFEGTVQKMIDAYYNKYDFGSAGAESWFVNKYCHYDYTIKDTKYPEYHKSILIEVF